MEALKAGELRRILLQRGIRGKIIEDLIALAKEKGIPWHWAESRDFQRFEGAPHQGVLGYLEPYNYCAPEELIQQAHRLGEPPFLLILDHIQDPGNLGSILRTAEAAGVHGVVIPSRRAAEVTPAVRKVSAGALSYLPVAKVVNLTRAIKMFQEEGLWIFGSDQDGDTPYYDADFSLPLALVIGSEGRGVSPLLRKNCDFLISVPMRGRIGSLNAAAASALLIYEVCRRRCGWQV